MCGIAGWQRIGGAAGAAAVRAMSASVAHRGPDDEGFYEDAAAGLAIAHRRLSVIDPTPGSHQPMRDESAGVVLSYNGELYNFQGLRGELEGLGHRFASRGDTEVVLRAYLEWGPRCFERFNGMFALALWDPRDACLHLARDALGMKPLYFLADAHGVAFASEVKAFRALPHYQPAVDDAALSQYLEFGYVFEPGRTMLRGVRKLDPGCRIEVRAGRIAKMCAWYSPPAPAPDDPRDEAARLEETDTVLSEVTRQHLIADVPLALLLSGGLDSSLIAALAAREGPLLTISMAFEDSAIDERPHAREVSRFIGSRHVEVSIGAEDVRREAESGAWVFDDLFADWGAVTTRLLYRRCRQEGIKAVLVGEGADELFGGYEVFNVPPRLPLWQQFRLYQRYCGRRYGRLFPLFRSALGEYLRESAGDSFHAVRLLEIRHQLPNQFVMKVDKGSMAESVEARAPYLDRRVADLALRTPREWLLREGENKYLLRAFARSRRLLPDAITRRAKFGAPLAADWMDRDPQFRAFARSRIMDGAWGSRTGLRGAMDAYFVGGKPGFPFPRAVSIFSNLAWRLLLLELWSAYYLAP